MALFSRRKKSADDPVPVSEPASVDETTGGGDEAASSSDAAPAAPAPTVGISVQAFRGVGAAAGPEVVLPSENAEPAAPPVRKTPASAPSAPQQPVNRALPLAPALPPEQTESIPGMKDNVLLREALAELADGATNEQLLGVLRQALQGHLYLRVHGDAGAQLTEGEQLSIAVVRDGDRSFMLAFSSAKAVRESVQRETEPTAKAAVAQPVLSVLQQAVAGEFTGLILDNASAPHRAVFPLDVLKRAAEQAQGDVVLKTLLAAPRQADSTARIAEALAKTKVWVAVNDGSGSGQVGIAEAQTADGRRFLQLFTHPLEVVALGRGDRPLPFTPEQLAGLLTKHTAVAGVLLDPAGPSIILERDVLAPVMVLAVDLGD